MWFVSTLFPVDLWKPTNKTVSLWYTNGKSEHLKGRIEGKCLCVCWLTLLYFLVLADLTSDFLFKNNFGLKFIWTLSIYKNTVWLFIFSVIWTLSIYMNTFFIFWVIFDPCSHGFWIGFPSLNDPQTFARFACLWKTLESKLVNVGMANWKA